MPQPIRDAASLCKTIMRNGYDAYVIGAALHERLLAHSKDATVDICTDLDLDGLRGLFPEVKAAEGPMFATLTQGESVFHFYAADVLDASHPEVCVAQLTPRMILSLQECEEFPLSVACPYIPQPRDTYDGFESLDRGVVQLKGIPDETLKHDYSRAIRALRFAANYHLPIEANTWMALVRSSRRVLDYVSVTDIMDEWRKVEAENMWRFVQLLFETMILHGLVPELAALSRIFETKSEDQHESVWEHTVAVMRHYPEELPYDWYGTLACLFHDCGKLYTGESVGERITFYQHHRVGAKVARKILKRLRFNTDEVDLICHLVRHHMHFHFMLTDKGIRRFKALDEYPRLIEIARANIKARGAAYTEFNHNMKMLDRADIREELLEPLLNGKQIMDIAGIKPGPAVGLIRDSLLQAQISGDVATVDEAVQFVLRYKELNRL
ncbi:MAG: HD domain-containing protein [Desulfomicrobiaceae bacterium]